MEAQGEESEMGWGHPHRMELWGRVLPALPASGLQASLGLWPHPSRLGPLS